MAIASPFKRPTLVDVIPVLDQLRRDALHCSIPEALEAVGERWTFLIVRGAFNGMRHFEQFQTHLGIARNILSNRLVRLVEFGIMARLPCDNDRRRIEYRLTDKGEALLPVLVALRQWGEDWGSGVPTNPVLVDAHNRRPVAPVRVHSEDGRPLGLHDLRWVDRSTLEPDAGCLWKEAEARPAGVDAPERNASGAC